MQQAKALVEQSKQVYGLNKEQKVQAVEMLAKKRGILL